MCLPEEVFRLRSAVVMQFCIIRDFVWITIQDVRAIDTTKQATCSFDGGYLLVSKTILQEAAQAQLQSFPTAWQSHAFFFVRGSPLDVGKPSHLGEFA